MDVRGQQLLAGARFADQQHARIGARGHRRLFHRALETPGSTRSFRARPAASRSRAILLLQRALLERILNRDHHAVAAQRLLEEVECAGARGFHGVAQSWRGRKS